MTLFSQLYWIRRSLAVQRFHGFRLVHSESVGHHSSSVAFILIQIYGDLCSSELLRVAILHDYEEHITGDIPAPVKWWINGASANIEILEAQILNFFKIHHPRLTEEEWKMLRGADFIDGVFKCLEERLLGNHDVDIVFENYRRFHNESCILDGLPEMQEVWQVILGSYQHLLAMSTPTAVHEAALINFWRDHVVSR